MRSLRQMISAHVVMERSRAGKPTPGEWSLNKDGEIVSKDGQIVGLAIRTADGLVMAAAPLALEALENIENDDKRIPAAIWELRNRAIKQARGEKA